MPSPGRRPIGVGDCLSFLPAGCSASSPPLPRLCPAPRPSPPRRSADFVSSAVADHALISDPGYIAEKFESSERINSIRETNGICDSCYLNVNGWEPADYMSSMTRYLLFVSRIEFIRSKLSNFAAHVSVATDQPTWSASTATPTCEANTSPAAQSLETAAV